ncbi:SDR family oxidoreductase [Embleya scabrispora]|uniref:SDR family oxidoreductase n=1 Tax=Embleya scabrispora TaxID=159449 RepID=UPI00037915F4|nr:NAD(P)-dependent oxidoreductase [Embleya scabrispora]MYS79387.1 SDR family NAD(P)-dependent oxidoreductase [Streptomyces sp. SID5474]
MTQPGRPALAGKTVVMSGGSRGIGLAIALRAAADGANVVLIAKTDTPHPRLRGTIHTAAEAIRAAGGTALPVVGDIRSDATIEAAVEAAVEAFGGIDICINNASVLDLSPTTEIRPKAYDLMQDVNVRGTFMLSRACLPHLKRAANPHILSLSPPLNLSRRWLGAHPAYTVAKYAMTLTTLTLAAENATDGIAANCLWPQTLIATDAVANVIGGQEAVRRSRQPRIMADAAYDVITGPSIRRTGQTLLDEGVLREAGVTDFTTYAVSGDEPETDLFLD